MKRNRQFMAFPTGALFTASLVVAGLGLQACSAGDRETDHSGDLTRALITPTNVVTQHNDLARTGANLSEKTLNTSNVNSSHFGKLFSRIVDGQIYAQPLYVALAIGSHNVVYVATQHNSVYAFDADDTSAATALWHVNLGPSVPAQDTGCPLISPEIGITSTPTIDLASKTIFVEAKTKEGGGYVHRLHALDLTSGQEKPNSPAVIQATASGTGDGSVGSVITMDPLKHLNRPGLLNTNGVIYLAFGSNCDIDPYHGWVLAYDQRTLRQLGVFIDTPTGSRGGIWQSGAGLSADADGSVFLATGNGDFGAGNFGNSMVKLHSASGAGSSGGRLTVTTSFTPSDSAALNASDLDIGSTGVLLLPGTNLAISGSKSGAYYLVDRSNMGGFTTGRDGDASSFDRQIVQRFQGVSSRAFGSPVYWNRSSNPLLYVWGQDDHLQAYRFNGSKFDTTPVVSTNSAARGGSGGQLSLSADGDRPGTGILWTLHATNGTGALVQAFDAADITHELWNSTQNPRDDASTVAKFNTPTIADGKVFVPTFSQKLIVYGLLKTNGPTPTPSPTTRPTPAPTTTPGPQPTPSHPATWTATYTQFFGPGTPGHCGNSGCHAQLHAAFKCGSKDECFNSMVAKGLIDRVHPSASRLGNHANSPLAWFGGAMPLDNPTPNPDAARAVTAWLASGANND
ncbi:MAG: hypothetical protein NVSMB1_15620 [Polyangiales bacterium]